MSSPGPGAHRAGFVFTDAREAWSREGSQRSCETTLESLFAQPARVRIEAHDAKKNQTYHA